MYMRKIATLFSMLMLFGVLGFSQNRTITGTVSDENKFITCRKLWIALAQSQKELGINISEEQIQNMKKYQSLIRIYVKYIIDITTSL